jgi:sugar lactone lactonase YvrE
VIAEVVIATRCRLGEGPTWQRDRERLLWLDIDGQILHSLDVDGLHSETALDRRVTCVAARVGGGLIGAAAGDIVTIEDDGTVRDRIARIPGGSELSTNDGRCDPSGRLWVGTVDRTGMRRAALFVVAGDGSVRAVREGIGLSNGVDWSPDGRRVYYVDSHERRLDVAELDSDGDPLRWRSLVAVDAIPDGLTVDAEGGVWLALWDGGSVHRYSSSGRLDAVVEIGGGFVTSCAFGEGRWATTLFVTTASVGIEPGTPRHRGAGALYALDVGVAGRGYTAFG